MKHMAKQTLPRKQISLRIPSEIHKGVVALAEREHRSIHAQIIYALERHLEDETEPEEIAA